jgi:hypothetical protein
MGFRPLGPSAKKTLGNAHPLREESNPTAQVSSQCDSFNALGLAGLFLVATVV